MQVINSFWFWLIIIGLLLILIAILIGGGMEEINSWTWAVFILGAVLGLLGIIFAIITWSRYVPLKNEYISSPIASSVESLHSPKSHLHSSPFQSHLQSPKSHLQSPKSCYSSPIGTPTKVTTNIPQAKRGFTASVIELSSLAPK